MIARAGERFMAGVHGVIASTYFPQVRDAGAMLGWIGYLRIFIGLVALYRTGLMAEASRFYYGNPAEWTGLVNLHATELALLQCILLVLFTVGFLTPLVTAGIIWGYPEMDSQLGTSTLGTYTLSILLIFFLLAGGGSRASVDALLARRFRWMRWVYVLGRPDARQLTVYCFGVFVAYALLSLGAILHHVADEYWQDGETVEVLMTSSYLTRFWEPTREIQELWPWGLSAFSQTAVIGQTIFQFAMIPLVWLRWGRWFVVAWGGMFIFISAVFMQLSYLPFVEIGLWALVWVRPRQVPALEVLYDDGRRASRRAAARLRAADPLRAFAFLPLSQHGEIAAARGVTDDDLAEGAVAIRDGEVLRGDDRTRAVVRAEPLLWPLVPIVEVGRLTGIGAALARRRARRRAARERDAASAGALRPSEPVAAAPQRPIVSATAVALLSAAALSATMTFSSWQGLWDSLGLRPWGDGLTATMNDIHRTTGFIPPDVFNRADLKMGEQWWTATWSAPGGRGGVVPLNNPDGSRASYTLADSLYFGNSLRWRRGMIDQDLNDAHAVGTDGRKTIHLVLRYHRRREGGPGPFTYNVKLWKDRSTDTSLPLDERYDARVVGGYADVVE